MDENYEYMKRQAKKCKRIVEIDGKFFRKEKEGSLTKMYMCDPIFSWLSVEELCNLRQSEPRLAP
jgi:hypothetical protein